MPEPFLISKAFDLSGAALGKSASNTIKGLLVVGVIAGGIYTGWLIYKKVMQRSEIYQAEKIEKQDNNLSFTQPIFGCARITIQNPEALKPLIRIGSEK